MIRYVVSRCLGGHGAARDTRHLPDRQHRAGRSGADGSSATWRPPTRCRWRSSAPSGASICRCGSNTGCSSNGWRMVISVCRSPRAGRCCRTSSTMPPRRSSSRPVAFILSLLVGLPLGVLAAVRRDTVIDHIARAVSLDRRLGADLLAGLHRARGILRLAELGAGSGAARSGRRFRPTASPDCC